MYPDLFGIANSTYWILVSLGIVAAAVLYRFLSTPQGLKTKSYNFYLFLGVASIAIGFAFAAIFQGLYDLPNREGLFFGEPQGITFMGGLVGGAITFVLGAIILGKKFGVRQDFWKVVNILSISLVAAHSLGRLGCFFAGCCYGISNERFGVTFRPHRGPVLPTNLYESLFLMLLFAVMLIIFLLPQIYGKLNKDKVDVEIIAERKESLARHRSKLIIIYLLAYSVFRFFLEFLRGDNRGAFLFGTITPSQIQSLIMFGIGIALLIIVHFKGIIPFQRITNNE
ncbi:MAG: prolipoprotein diacylglyceryl transferase [Firmicutes bacterium]|nr:prolipoprotein diacylglyceryl transferase [Bacillota bacterium]